MKRIKAASLIAASVIAVSSFGSLTAGAVTFSEDETTGAKTWTFVVTDSDYPEGVTTDEKNGDKNFESGTYYVNSMYSMTGSSDNNLLMTVTDGKTVESKANNTLYLCHSKGSSSTLSWTVPENGTIALTSTYGLYISINNGDNLLCGSNEYETYTENYNVTKGDTIKISAPKYGGIKELEFTPVQNYTAMYSFEQTANDLNGKTLYIDSTAGPRTKELTGTYFTGNGDVKLGVIITSIPRDVEITSVTIQ